MNSLQQINAQAFLELRVFADSYYQLQQQRIQINQRLQASAIPKEVVNEILESIQHSENMAKKAMQSAFRRAAPWVSEWLKTEETVGIGPHLMARLLGVIGHPVVTTPHHWEGVGKQRRLVEDPVMFRSISALWAYCGVRDHRIRRKKGASAEENAAAGNSDARMLVYLLSLSVIRQTGRVASEESIEQTAPGTGDPVLVSKPSLCARSRSPYRDIYDLARLRYSVREEWTAAHQHKAALRIVGKEILRDLWVITMKHMNAQLDTVSAPENKDEE